MKYYSLENNFEQVTIEPDIILEDAFTIIQPSSVKLFCMPAHFVKMHFFLNKEDAVKEFNSRLKHKIKFHQEEIAKLLKEIIC
jgi:hypothetical protein